MSTSPATAIEPRYDLLVDPRTGLIRHVHEVPADPRLPRGIRSLSARAADLNQVIDWPADPVAGANGLDPEGCYRAAVGEFVERYCGNYVPERLRLATWNDWRDRGVAAIDPEELALYSPTQYRSAGFPFVPFTRDLPVRWTRGTSLVSGASVQVPASLVWVNYFSGPRADEPPTNFQMFSGLAAGAGPDMANLAGLRELLERDATMMWWLADYPAVRVEVPEDTAAGRLLADTGDGITWHVVAIPSDFEVPVAGVLLVDDVKGIAGMGFGCRATLEDAVIKGIGEAVQLHRLAEGILDSDGLAWRALAKGVIHDRSLKPYRADRRYLDSYASDFHDVTDLIHHSQIYLDRGLWGELDRIIEPGGTVRLSDWPTLPREDLATYVDVVASKGFEAVSVDVTTDDIRTTGLAATRVVVPGLLPNGPTGFPFLGGDRLYRVPPARGWTNTPPSESTLNLAPLPHS